MSVIYFKASAKRRKKFQIKTTILKEETKKYVVKEPIYRDGKKHLYDAFLNQNYLLPVFGEMTVVSDYVENKLITPYIEGESFTNKLRKALLTGNEDAIEKLLTLWKKIIRGKNNDCIFDNSENFQMIFGDAKELIGDEAIGIANLDCSADNIFFLSNDTIKIIDYEWVFSFPVPLELAYYRVLQVFYLQNKEVTDWEYLLNYSKIEQSKISIYERLLAMLTKYIFFEESNGINYATLGDQFLIAKISEETGNKSVKYVFPKDIVPKGSRIVLYGAGQVGQEFYQYLRKQENIELVHWVDKRANVYKRQGLNVDSVEKIKLSSFDYILIAIRDDTIVEQVKMELAEIGILADKIIWERYQIV